MGKNDYCPRCWHQDCTCGTDIEKRMAAQNARQAREAAKKIARERKGKK